MVARSTRPSGTLTRTEKASGTHGLLTGAAPRFGPALERGDIRPIIDRVLPLDQVGEAHRVIKASEHFGKIVLRW